MFIKRVSAIAAISIASLMASNVAWSQVAVQQTLDSVKVHSDTKVLNMNFDDPQRLDDFTDSGINGTDYKACKLASIGGLYCLDGSTVFKTTNFADPSSKEIAIDCGDPLLDLDTKKGEPCTTMTVDAMGNVWLGTKTKGKSHGLVKATPDMGDPCPAPTITLAAGGYCAEEVATGRPLLVDLSSIDGDFGAEFFHGPGILGLEQRRDLVFFPSTGGTPILISDGKGWGLKGKELLTSATAVIVRDEFSIPSSYVLAVTTNGRVLARLADGTGDVDDVFDIPSNRGPATQCNFDDTHYGIRASGKSGTVYLTDRQYCISTALDANANNSGELTDLSVATENVGMPPTASPLILSTDIGGGMHAPIGPTVSPGINVDLDYSVVNCVLIVDEQGNQAAELNNVTLASAKSGLTLFQVKNIPDCRYDPQTCIDLLDDISTASELISKGVITDPDSGNPAAQLLNLTRLLPKEITDLFVMSGGLPDMWLPRQYRGQKDNGFVFEAFFGVTEDGVIFRDTFEGVFDVQALAGSELGCVTGLPQPSPLSALLAWDIIGTVSERVPTFAHPVLGAGAHVATLTNSGCSSSKSSGTRWSIKPYNMEVTPCTYNGDPGDVWDGDGFCIVGGAESADDAVFAKLLLGLFDDFKSALDELACIDADGAGSAPLSGSACSTLSANWTNAKDKLDKCWSATQQPKQSSGSQNCTSFVSQLNGLRNNLNAVFVPAPPLDPENRIGELKSRLKVITHVHDERFVPSIPANGYAEP
ncbi:MAG: hypothetical protein HKN77_09275 [Woeseiaceae bacterium]|nr:hypothetical protein [Woeseiaceae bacterium]